MRISKLITLAGLSVAFSATASAQFSVSGPGSLIPASGTGGDAVAAGDGGATYDTVQAGVEATSTVVVGSAVSGITSIDIQGLAHSWVGDTQATLEDPAGVEHLIWLRPGFLNTSNFGNSGDFDGGNYTFVGDGSGSALPTTSGAAAIPAGTYNQTFATGGTTWVSGTNGINSTPMGMIAGPAGNWTLHIYDWGAGDTGSFSGWTLNGNGGSVNSGTAYCFGDGTGATCPCSAVSGAGSGCPNTTGSGMTLAGAGNADTANDTFSVGVTGGPASKPGIFFQGTNVLGNPVGDGIICSNASMRYGVQILDASGAAGMNGLGVNAVAGGTLNYQFWYRDTGNACTQSFNFSNGLSVTWN
jgi:hypothetical protein